MRMPDISYEQLADRYYDLVGTALRSPGQAWMAACAGLEYIGVFVEKFLSVVPAGDGLPAEVKGDRHHAADTQDKTIDLAMLCYTVKL